MFRTSAALTTIVLTATLATIALAEETPSAATPAPAAAEETTTPASDATPSAAATAGTTAPASTEGAPPSAETTPASADSVAEASAALVAEVGKAAPDFTLMDTDGNKHVLSALLGKVVVLEWFNPDCPFVKKHHQVNRSMAETQAKAKKQDIVWLAINSGGPGKQGHGLKRNAKARKEYKIDYPVLLDEAGVVGHSYGAKTTPQMFVINEKGLLIYIGSLDNNPSPTDVGDINYVKNVINACAAGTPVDPANTKSYGCSVKYGS